ncbi:MAG TPA: hypothetical protein VFH87_01540, partial [Candidatus Udaeobacter sp.]|nr:hypothetical protein [Candidatus Udaeobacter sp.]
MQIIRFAFSLLTRSLPHICAEIAQHREISKVGRFPLPAHYHPSVLFVRGGLLVFTEPRYVFGYYMASFYKWARSSEFWIEHANVGRKCRQESTK